MVCVGIFLKVSFFASGYVQCASISALKAVIFSGIYSVDWSIAEYVSFLSSYGWSKSTSCSLDTVFLASSVKKGVQTWFFFIRISGMDTELGSVFSVYFIFYKPIRKL